MAIVNRGGDWQKLDSGGGKQTGGGGPMGPYDLLKLVIGDVPASWVRLVAFGAMIAWFVFSILDFKRDVQRESLAVRQSLGEYIAANKAWQDFSSSERRYLLGRVNSRFERVYKRNRWEYEPIEIPQ